MSSPSELIVNAKHFSPDAIAYQSAKVNSRGGKSVQIRLQGQPLVLAIPLMFTWGVNERVDETSGRVSYDLAIVFENEKSATISRFCDKLKEMQIKAFIFMLDHFGLVYEADEIEKGPAFQECKHRLAHDNHNLLRITRILRSLYLLDQKCLAKKFFSFLSELRLNDIFIMDVTYYHWANAVMDGCSCD